MLPVVRFQRRRPCQAFAWLMVPVLLFAASGGIQPVAAGLSANPANQPAAAAPASVPEGLPGQPTERRISRQVAPGVRHVQVLREGRTLPLAAHIVRADLRQPGWRLQAWPARDRLITEDATRGREAVGALAARRNALAALNGDFFPFTGDPLGLQITEGELYSEPYPNRSAFGITRDGRTLWGPVRFEASVTIGGRSFPVRGINRPRQSNEIVLYTPRYAASTGTNAFGVDVVVEWLDDVVRPGATLEGTVSESRPGQGDTRIPAEGLVLSGHGAGADFLRQVGIGDGMRLRVNLTGEDGQTWNAAWQAIGGGPRLLRGGEVAVGPGAEGFRNDVLLGRAPRSVVGVTQSGELLLAAVDGRQWGSAGMTLAELAEWLRAEGVVDAINLDGGGSTTLALRQVVVNSPSEGTQRLVANALVLMLDGQPHPERDELAIFPTELPTGDGETLVITAGTRLRFRAARRLADGAWQDLPDDTVTWGLERAPGMMAQDGTLLGVRAGAGAVVVSTGRGTARFPVLVAPGPPATVTAALEQTQGGSAFVRSRVVDSFGNAVSGAALRLSYVTAEGSHAVTALSDAKGEARLALPLVLLMPNTPVTVAAGAAAPAMVRLPTAFGPVPGQAPGSPAAKPPGASEAVP